MKREYIFGVGLVLVAIISFVGGMQFQKSLKPIVTTSANGTMVPGGGSGFARSGNRPTFGTVASISATSMSVTTRSGSTVTVSLSGNPTVTDNGATSSLSAIATGDTVAVVGTVANGSVNATSIVLNPSFGRGSFGGGAPATAPNSSTNNGA